MIAIGRGLRRLGYDVVISLAEPYAAVAEQAGLEPHCLISRDQFDALLTDPSMWKPLRGMCKVIHGIAANYLEPHFELIRSRHRIGRTVLVSHPLDFASRIYRDIDPSTPLVDVHLAPIMLRVPEAPARLTSWWFEPTANRYTFRLSYWLGDRIILDPLLAGPINRIRKRNALPGVDRVMHRWWISPDLVLAMYPQWFAPSTIDVVPQLRHVGFPLDDATESPVSPPTDRPVVFTGGSANWHTKRFFERAVSVSESLQVPAILLGGNDACFPHDLPPRVRPLGYTPLGKLLPHCAAIVHHGGIGTTSQALRAGIPQLIRPLAYDQFDNASRVEHLGCGIALRRDRDLEAKLGFVLNDGVTLRAAEAIGGRFGNLTGAGEAVRHIDDLMTARTVPL